MNLAARRRGWARWVRVAAVAAAATTTVGLGVPGLADARTPAAGHVPSPSQPLATSKRYPTQVGTAATRAAATGRHSAGRPVPAGAVGLDQAQRLRHGTAWTPSLKHAALRVASPVVSGGFSPQRSVERPDLEDANTRIFQNPNGTYTATISAGPVNQRDEHGRWVHLRQPSSGSERLLTGRARTGEFTGVPGSTTNSSATYVESGNPGNHSNDGYLYLGYDSSYDTYSSYVQFPDLNYSTSSPGPFQGAYITSATLSLDDLVSSVTLQNTGCVQSKVDVTPVTSAWSASTLNTSPGPDASSSGPTTYATFSGPGTGVGVNCPKSGSTQGSPTTITIPVTQAVQDWVHGWLPNNGVELIPDGSNAFDEFSNSGTNKPSITFTYVADGDGANYAESSYISPVNNQKGSATVTVENEGSATWTPTNGYELDYELYTVSGSTRTLVTSPASIPAAVTSSVAPGAQVTLTPQLPALTPGSYQVCWDMRDTVHNATFSSLGVPVACYGLAVANNPPVIDSFNPDNNAIEYTLTPTLSVTAHDPDNYPAGATLAYTFDLYQNGNSTALATRASNASPQWTVPAGLLKYGGLYYWTVQVTDTVTPSPWSAPDYFTVPSAEQPLITSHLGAAPYDSTISGVDPSVGNYSTVATDATVPGVPSGPQVAITRTYNSLDPRIGTFFGNSWSTVLDMRAAPDTDGTQNVVITLADGRQERFAHNADGSYSPPDGVQAWLTSITGGYRLIDQARNQYTFTQATTDSITGQAIYGLSTIGAADRSALVTLTWASQPVTLAGGGTATLTLPTRLAGVGTSNPFLIFTWTGTQVTSAGATITLPEVHTVSFSVAHPDANTPANTWTYGYDGSGNLQAVCPPTSPTACTTYSYTSGASSGSHFASMISDSNPTDYWRLDDAAGASTAADAMVVHEGATNGLAANVTFGATGHLPGTPATVASFNGTNSYIVLPRGLIAGANLSVGLWFQTTQAGGTLFSYQDTSPNSTSLPVWTVPSLYIGSDGKLRGEFYDGGQLTPMTSAAAVDDGKWHYVVLSATGTTQSLWVDGQSYSRSGAALADGSKGPYVSIGAGGIPSGWPASPSGNSGHGWFNGQISDVWYAQHPVSAPVVAQEYAGGTSSIDELTGVTLPSGKTGVSISYDPLADRATSVTDSDGGTWKLPPATTAGSRGYYEGQLASTHPLYSYPLNETSGATAEDSLENYGSRESEVDGSYSSVLLGQPGIFGDSGDSAASFNGTSSYVNLPEWEQGAAFRSYGVWIKTTKAGGTILSEQDTPFGTTPTYWDPILYIGTDGKVHGGLNGGSTGANQILPVTSTSVVDDGQWHFIMLTAGQDDVQISGPPGNPADHEMLWVDGRMEDDAGFLESGMPGEYAGDDGNFFTELGAGSSSGYPNSDSATNPNGYFQGQIAQYASWDVNLNTEFPGTPALLFKDRGSATDLTPTTTQQVIDPAGNTSSYQFDPANGNRTISYTNALGNTTRYAYDDAGFQDSTIDANDNGATVRHDSLGDVVWSQTCPAQLNCNTTTATFDTSSSPTDYSAGKVLTQTDPLGNTTTDTYYSTNGLLDTSTAPAATGFTNGRKTSYAYTTTSTATVDGGAGHGDQLLSVTDPDGNVTSYTYDSGGQLASVTNPAGGKTTYGYTQDVYGVASQTVYSTQYPSGNVTTYTYDAQGRIKTETEPATTDKVTGVKHTEQTTYTYDNDGNLTTVAEADLTGGDPSRTTSYTYNAGNRVATMTDPNGNVTHYTYDAFGNMVTKTTPDGSVWRYTYSAANQLTQTSIDNWTGNGPTPASPTSLVAQQRSYDPGGRLAAVTDAENRTTKYFYDNANELALVASAYGSQDNVESDLYFDYDSDGHLTQRVGPCAGPSDELDCKGVGHNVVNFYDADGYLTGSTYDFYGFITQPPTSWSGEVNDTLDGDGNILTQTVNDGSKTGATSRKTTYTYNALGEVASQAVADGSTSLTTAYNYDTQGEQIGLTDPTGSLTIYSQDQRGRPTGSQAVDLSEPLVLSTSIGLDTYGDATSTEDGVGNITQASYDGDGNRTQLVEPSYTPPGSTTPIQPTTNYTYDSLNRLTATTDPLNRTTTDAYDQLGNVVSSTSPGNRTTTTSYDLDGEPIDVTDPTGAQTQTVYDSQGRVESDTTVERYPSLATYATSYTYDPSGDTLTVTDPLGTTTNTYDLQGERLTSTDPLGRVTTDSYGFPGEVATQTNPDGTQDQLTYDPLGRLSAVKDLDATSKIVRTESYGYDGDNRLTSYTDPMSQTSTTTYSNTGLVEKQVQPVTSSTSLTTSFTHDADGRVTGYTNPNGNTTNYTYNSLGLPESTIAPAVAGDTATADRATTTAYDADGRPSTITSPGGVSVTDSYDTAGNLIGQSGAGAQAPTTSRTLGYDADGRVTSVSAPGGTDTYTYDDRGLMLTAAGPGGASSFGYDGNANMTSRTDAAGSATFTYDADNELATQAGPNAGFGATYTYYPSGQVHTAAYGSVGTDTYTYNAEQQVTGATLTNTAGTTLLSSTYGYDAAGRETSAATSAPALSYSTSSTYGYDDADRLTSATTGSATTSYGYDGDGNRTSIGATTNIYNAQDELTSQTTGSATSTFTYTPQGTLASATGASGTNSVTSDAFGQQATFGTDTYSYDGLGRLATATTPVGSYAFTYDGASNVATSDGSQTFGRGPTGQPVSVGLPNYTGVSLTSPHGDVTATADSSGIVGLAAYSPAGQTTLASGLLSDLGFQGGWTDPGTLSTDTASRWYSSVLGAFTSADTATNTPTPAVNANHYAYANDNPLTNSDPSGHDACSNYRDEVRQEEERAAQEQEAEQRQIEQWDQEANEIEARDNAEWEAEEETAEAEESTQEAADLAEYDAASREIDAQEAETYDQTLESEYGDDSDVYHPNGVNDAADASGDGAGGSEGFFDTIGDAGTDLGEVIGGDGTAGEVIGDGIDVVGGLLDLSDCTQELPQNDATTEQTGQTDEYDVQVRPNADNPEDPLAQQANDQVTETDNQETVRADQVAQAPDSVTGTDNPEYAQDASPQEPPEVQQAEPPPTSEPGEVNNPNPNNATNDGQPTPQSGGGGDGPGDPPTTSNGTPECDPAGGVYSLRDPDTGEIVRTGRTNNLAQRRLQHLNDPVLGDYQFEPEFATDDYATQRGLEQMIFMDNPQADLVDGGFNKIQPISINNPNYDDYMQAAQDFLDGGGEC